MCRRSSTSRSSTGRCSSRTPTQSRPCASCSARRGSSPGSPQARSSTSPAGSPPSSTRASLSPCSPTAAGSTSRPISGRPARKPKSSRAPSGGDPNRDPRAARGPRARGRAERAVRARRAARRHGRALHSRPQRGSQPIPLRARDRARELVPRRRRLRAGRLPLARLVGAAPLAHRRREHRPLAGPALPDPLAGDRRARRLADHRRRDLASKPELGRPECALHAELRMAVDGADVRELPLLERDGERRSLVVGELRRLLATDLEVVLERALVHELEDDLPVRRCLAREDELVLLRGHLDGGRRGRRRAGARERRDREEDRGADRAHDEQKNDALHKSPWLLTPYAGHDTSLSLSSSGSCGTSSTSSRSMREPSTSSTLKRVPSCSTSSPRSGARPSSPNTKPPTVW